jgi:hypothetical protein
VLSYSHRIGLGIDDLRQADFALVGARGQAPALPDSWSCAAHVDCHRSQATTTNGDVDR